VSVTTADYVYYGDKAFGNTAVYPSLHSVGGGKLAASVSSILAEDNFANNNNDLASGNVHQAKYAGSFAGISEDGTYRILVNGIIKGNDATVGQEFSVASTLVTIGGCTQQ
jgi:hypothetical protein